MSKLRQFSAGALTGAVGVLGIKSYFQFRDDLTTAEKRVKTQGKIAATKFGIIAYGTNGQGPPVLVIHGAGGGFDQALHSAQMFGEGFQWIAPSRFGYLGTPLPEDASPAAQADAHAALLDALKIERVPIIGLSAGGPSAIQFALRHPERCSGLVMVSAISRAMVDVAANPEVLEKLFSRLLAGEWLIWMGLQLAIRKIVPPLGVPMRIIKKIDEQDTAWLQTLLEYVLPVQPRRAGLVNDYAQILRLDIFPLDKIDAPTLVIHAQDDSLVSIKQGRFSAKNIPHARLVKLASGGHLLLSQRDHVRAEVEPFLNNVITQPPTAPIPHI